MEFKLYPPQVGKLTFPTIDIKTATATQMLLQKVINNAQMRAYDAMFQTTIQRKMHERQQKLEEEVAKLIFSGVDIESIIIEEVNPFDYETTERIFRVKEKQKMLYNKTYTMESYKLYGGEDLLTKMRVSASYLNSLEFRPPRKGEKFINQQGKLALAQRDYVGPVLIYREPTTSEVYGKTLSEAMLKVDSEYTFEGFRVPTWNDIFISRRTNEAVKFRSGIDVQFPRIIVKRIERPSIRSVYGVDTIPIPSGYEWNAFRLIKVGDLYIDSKQHSQVNTCLVNCPEMWRITVEKVEETPTMQSIYKGRALLTPSGFEYIGFRKAKPGDWYISCLDGKSPLRMCETDGPNEWRAIIRRVSEFAYKPVKQLSSMMIASDDSSLFEYYIYRDGSMTRVGNLPANAIIQAGTVLFEAVQIPVK